MAGTGARGFTAGPQIFGRTLLESGARIVTEELPGRPTVSLGVWVGSGSRAEAPGLEGGAHFIEHLLFKGTKKRTAAALAKEIDAIGGHLDAFTSREYTAYYLNLLVDHVERGMDILADILLHSTFPAAEVERERRVILEEIRSADDNPEDCVYELLVQGMWRGNALGRPILGGHASVGAVTRARLLEFFAGHYRSANLVFAGAGGLGHAQLERLWRRHFPFPKRSHRPPRQTAPRVRPGFYGRPRELEQAYLVCGCGGLEQDHPDRYALYVLNTIVGGSMSSRLFQEVREKRGLAYSVFSSHTAYRDTGLFSISVGTRPDQAAQVVRIVRRELARIAERAPGAKEVARARDHLKGNLVLGLESGGHRMMKLAKQEIYFGRQFTIADTLRRIDAVEPKQLRELAARLFEPARCAWSAVGPAASVEKAAREVA
ncbi:MAG TPA: pitrilysin family protein [bacterium]